MLTRSTFTFIALFSSVSVFIVACGGNSMAEEKKDDITKLMEKENEDFVSRGHYLINISGCNDCHSPKKFSAPGPEVDSPRLLSGHPSDIPLESFNSNALKPMHWIQMAPDITSFVGPWGVSFAANLTPDSTTGIGAWTEEVFIKAVRTGKHLGQENGRPILPPMPWPQFTKMTDNDIKAVYAYLRSLPPIHNRVPVPLSPQEAAKLAK